MEATASASTTATQMTAGLNDTSEEKTLVLRLREKKVSWDSEVVNNEFMGKKSSKSMKSTFKLRMYCNIYCVIFRMLYISQDKEIWRERFR